jgi:POT family proton-dependent oligopeptide transporter
MALPEMTDNDLALALRLADLAGAAIRPLFRGQWSEEKKADRSFVTEADRAAEAAMRRLIEAEFPRDGIIGEEYGTRNEGAGRQWVLDPIDGTTSFIAGRPIFGTLIALPFLGIVQVSPIELQAYGIFVIVGMAALYFAYLLFFAGLDGVERKRVMALIVLFVACALFWSGFEQAGSSLNLFAERYTDRVIGAFTVPAGWFQSLNAIFIVIFAPVFSAIWVNLARRNLDPSTPIKFALGLIGMAIGFLMMFLAARVVADGLPAAAYWLVLTYLFHTFGELCLSPVGLSSVTKLVPHRFVGQSLGIWFLAVSLGNLVAGKIAGEFDADNVSAMPGQYLDIFWFGMVAAVVLFLLSPVVKRWMGGVK